MFSQGIRQTFGNRLPVAEIDISFTNATPVVFATSLTGLGLNYENYEYANIQFYDSASDVGVLVAKYSLATGYALAANPGTKLLNTAQLAIEKQEMPAFTFVGEVAGPINAHVTLYA